MYDTTLHRLRVFRAVVEQGGIDAAAAELGIAQPSVSAHVKALEGLVGQPLLERRRGRQVTVTAAGRLFYDYALEVLLGAEEVERLLAAAGGDASVRISLATSAGLAHSLLAPVLVEFARRRPEVPLAVHTGALRDVEHLLSSGNATLGVVVTLGDVPGLHSEVLREVDVVVVAAAGHPLAGRRLVTVEELSGEPFVTPLRSSAHFQVIDGLLGKAGLAGYRMAMELEEGPALKSVVRQGFGVAPVLETTVHDDLESGALVALALPAPLPCMEVRLVHRPRKQFTDVETELVGLLREDLAHGGAPPVCPPQVGIDSLC